MTEYNYQRAAKFAGEQGCKFLSVCHLCNSVDNWPRWHATALRSPGSRIVDEEFYFFDAPRMFGLMCGGEWTETTLTPDSPYVCAEGEFELLHWRKSMTAPTNPGAHHYTTGDGSGKLGRDPWPGSNCVTYGSIVERLIYRRKP